MIRVVTAYRTSLGTWLDREVANKKGNRVMKHGSTAVGDYREEVEEVKVLQVFDDYFGDKAEYFELTPLRMK